MNYLKLFDIIEKQKQYNEEKIVRMGIVKKEHLPPLKYYLYNLVLESMRILRSKGNNIDSRLRNMLENARIFQERGLEQEETKLLEKTKQLAFRHERWGLALDVLLKQGEKMTYNRSLNIEQELQAGIETIFKKTDNLMKYFGIMHTLIILMKTSDFTPTSEQIKKLKKLSSHRLLCNEKEAVSVAAKINYYYALSTLHYLKNDHKTCYTILIRNLHLIERNYSVLPFPELKHLNAINRLVVIQYMMGKYGDAYDLLQKGRDLLKKISPFSPAVLYYYGTTTHYFNMVPGYIIWCDSYDDSFNTILFSFIMDHKMGG